jgi:transposase
LSRLHGYLYDYEVIEYSYRTLLRTFYSNDYARVVPRPEHPDRDEEARQKFLTRFKDLAQASDLRIYFGDEVGFEGDPRPRTKWVKRGSKPVSLRTGSHVRTNVIGAVCPNDGELFSLIVPHTDKEVFQVFLDEFAFATKHHHDAGMGVVLILDNASWHKSSSLNWHHIKPEFLPPYSPDLNPIEQLWREIKSYWLPNYFTKCENTLVTKVWEILTRLMKIPEQVASITSFAHLVK